MATKNKKTVEQKVVKPTDTIEENYIEEVVKPTDKELIMGASPEMVVKKVVDYTSYKRIYRVKNIAKNRVYTLNGYEIGAILGTNAQAREELKNGAKKVILKENKLVNNNLEVVKKYHIEVIK